MKKSIFFYYLKYTILALLFPCFALLYTLEFSYFSNTFEVSHLFIISLCLGVCLGVGLAFRYKNDTKDGIERFQIFAFCIALAVILMPLLISLSNRLLCFSPIRYEKVELFKTEAIISDRFGLLVGEEIKANVYYIFFFRKGELHRIKSKKALFVDKERGDSIDIPILKGLWGYELVCLD